MNKKILIPIVAILVVISIGLYMYGTRNVLGQDLSSKEISALHTIASVYTKQSDLDTHQGLVKTYKDQIGKGISSDYDLNVAIAQQYGLLGDGENAYAYLQKAIKIDSEKSLAYLNLGNLFTNAQLYDKAADAFKMAVSVEPQYAQNHMALIDFYTKYKPNETSKIQSIFDDARKHTGDDVNILKLYAQWLTDTKNYVKAIDVWKLVLRQYPDSKDTIQREIDRITKKLDNNA